MSARRKRGRGTESATEDRGKDGLGVQAEIEQRIYFLERVGEETSSRTTMSLTSSSTSLSRWCISPLHDAGWALCRCSMFVRVVDG